jgi:hypothetical protein
MRQRFFSDLRSRQSYVWGLASLMGVAVLMTSLSNQAMGMRIVPAKVNHYATTVFAEPITLYQYEEPDATVLEEPEEGFINAIYHPLKQELFESGFQALMYVPAQVEETRRVIPEDMHIACIEDSVNFACFIGKGGGVQRTIVFESLEDLFTSSDLYDQPVLVMNQAGTQEIAVLQAGETQVRRFAVDNPDLAGPELKQQSWWETFEETSSWFQENLDVIRAIEKIVRRVDHHPWLQDKAHRQMDD